MLVIDSARIADGICPYIKLQIPYSPLNGFAMAKFVHPRCNEIISIFGKTLTKNKRPVFLRPMKTKAIGLGLAFCLLAAASSFATNPIMGTWKLNEAKSKLTPGRSKNKTVVYQSSLFQVKITVDGVDPKGKPTHSEWIGRFDGKDCRVTGDPNSDTRSYMKIDDRTMEFVAKQNGKVVVTGRIVVSPDGKSRTVTTTGTTSKGKKFKNIAVYNKV